MVAACGLLLAPLSAQEANGPMAKGIQDNSFLIEEAYNQEPGMVQHIATLRRLERDWLFAFTQEWPAGSQTHQVSYTVPYSWLRSGGQSADGFGDLMLNYRWQALMESARNREAQRRWCSSRLASRAASSRSDSSFPSFSSSWSFFSLTPRAAWARADGLAAS